MGCIMRLMGIEVKIVVLRNLRVVVLVEYKVFFLKQEVAQLLMSVVVEGVTSEVVVEIELLLVVEEEVDYLLVVAEEEED